MWDLVSYSISWFLLDVSLCMLYFEIPFMPRWWDDHHAWVLWHTDRSLLTEGSCSATSLATTPAWGNFPCMIVTSSLCISSILTTLNAAAYTFLRAGPREVVPPGQTPLSMACAFMCWWISYSSSLQHANVFIYLILKMQSNTSWK